MCGAIPPLPQHFFVAWCSVKHRDNAAHNTWRVVLQFNADMTVPHCSFWPMDAREDLYEGAERLFRTELWRMEYNKEQRTFWRWLTMHEGWNQFSYNGRWLVRISADTPYYMYEKFYTISVTPYAVRIHLCLGFRSGLFSTGFPPNILCTFLISCMHSTCTDHLMTMIIEVGGVKVLGPQMGLLYRSLVMVLAGTNRNARRKTAPFSLCTRITLEMKDSEILARCHPWREWSHSVVQGCSCFHDIHPNVLSNFNSVYLIRNPFL
jgi:hypothetical protein